MRKDLGSTPITLPPEIVALGDDQLTKAAARAERMAHRMMRGNRFEAKCLVNEAWVTVCRGTWDRTRFPTFADWFCGVIRNNALEAYREYVKDTRNQQRLVNYNRAVGQTSDLSPEDRLIAAQTWWRREQIKRENIAMLFKRARDPHLKSVFECQARNMEEDEIAIELNLAPERVRNISRQITYHLAEINRMRDKSNDDA